MKLSIKIIIIQVILTVSVLTIFGIFTFINSSGQMSASLNKEGEIAIESLSQILVDPVWEVDTDQILTLMDVQMLNSDVLGVLFIEEGEALGKYADKEGNVRTYAKSAEIDKMLENNLFFKQQDIIYLDDNLGTLKIYYTDKNIAIARNSQLLGLIIQIVILSGFIVGIFSIYGSRMGKKLNTVIGLLKNIAAGKIKSLEKVNIPQNDEIGILANTFNKMLDKLQNISTNIQKVVVNLNSASQEIQSAAQEQASNANVSASGITEVSATIEELSITAKQITKNASELVVSSGEATKSLEEGKNQLMDTVNQLDEAGAISMENSKEIKELGKRSVLINEMVEIIKEVVNATNMLSINASIEASRAGEAGKGFSVVAAEIRELSKETITSAKKVEKAAREIQGFIDSIIISSESESRKVLESGQGARKIYNKMENIIKIINNNYSFTQKIDISIKQQERGSDEAAETMRQMASNSRQSADVAKQTSAAVKEIVILGHEIREILKTFDGESREFTEKVDEESFSLNDINKETVDEKESANR